MRKDNIKTGVIVLLIILASLVGIHAYHINHLPPESNVLVYDSVKVDPVVHEGVGGPGYKVRLNNFMQYETKTRRGIVDGPYYDEYDNTWGYNVTVWIDGHILATHNAYVNYNPYKPVNAEKVAVMRQNLQIWGDSLLAESIQP